ncbi:hypothetical protein MOKP4_43220 [Mycobacterium avium subsp. hominissuis]
MTLPRLIACDVDGTLFDDDERITPRTRAAVRAAVAGGARFVVATGRPPRWIRPVVDALGFAPIAVCANGAVIYDPANDRVLSARTLDVDTLAELAELATRVIPGRGWPSSGSGNAPTTRRRRSSSARRVTSTPG